MGIVYFTHMSYTYVKITTPEGGGVSLSLHDPHSPLLLAHLFVSEDKQYGISKFVLAQHSIQLIPGFANTFSIVTVHNKNKP